MARTSISLPDDFVERLEPLKAHINISQICHAALEAKVQTYEAIEQALSDEDVMRGLVKRLKLQKAEASDRSYAQGREDGQKWAIREASYQELGYWGPRNTRHCRPPQNSWEYEYPSFHDFIDGQDPVPVIEVFFPESNTAEQHISARRQFAERNNQPFELHAYRTGFLDAVMGIWDRVEQQLNRREEVDIEVD